MTHFSEIPHEIVISHIFPHLDGYSLKSVSEVNKRFNALTYNIQFWNPLDPRNFIQYRKWYLNQIVFQESLCDRIRKIVRNVKYGTGVKFNVMYGKMTYLSVNYFLGPNPLIITVSDIFVLHAPIKKTNFFIPTYTREWEEKPLVSGGQLLPGKIQVSVSFGFDPGDIHTKVASVLLEEFGNRRRQYEKEIARSLAPWFLAIWYIIIKI